MAALCNASHLLVTVGADTGAMAMAMVIVEMEIECSAGVLVAKSCVLHCVSPFLCSVHLCSLWLVLKIVCCQSSNWLLLLLFSLCSPVVLTSLLSIFEPTHAPQPPSSIPSVINNIFAASIAIARASTMDQNLYRSRSICNDIPAALPELVAAKYKSAKASEDLVFAPSELAIIHTKGSLPV